MERLAARQARRSTTTAPHDPVEFLAVAVEAFFEVPQLVRRRHRERVCDPERVLRPGPRGLGRRARARGVADAPRPAADPPAPGLSRRKAREVIEKGQVTVGGERVREAGHEVAEDASRRLRPEPPGAAAGPLHAAGPVRGRARDRGRQAGGPADGAVGAGAARRGHGARCASRTTRGGCKPRGGFAERVHRLDRDTSGAIAFALSPEARAGLIQTFRDHRIERTYVAIVAGEPREESGVVDAPLREEWTSGRKAVARGDEPARDGAHALDAARALLWRGAARRHARDRAPAPDPRPPRPRAACRSSATRCTAASPRSARGRSCTRRGSRSPTRSPASAWRSSARCRKT